MSLTDSVVLVAHPEFKLPWTLLRGRETFFDESNVMRRWATASEAIAWSESELGVSPLVDLPGWAQDAAADFTRRERLEDLPLFAKGQSNA